MVLGVRVIFQLEDIGLTTVDLCCRIHVRARRFLPSTTATSSSPDTCAKDDELLTSPIVKPLAEVSFTVEGGRVTDEGIGTEVGANRL